MSKSSNSRNLTYKVKSVGRGPTTSQLVGVMGSKTICNFLFIWRIFGKNYSSLGNFMGEGRGIPSKPFHPSNLPLRMYSLEQLFLDKLLLFRRRSIFNEIYLVEKALSLLFVLFFPFFSSKSNIRLFHIIR